MNVDLFLRSLHNLHIQMYMYVSNVSWTTIVVHSRDDQEVGVAHEVNPASVFPDDNGAVLVR